MLKPQRNAKFYVLLQRNTKDYEETLRLHIKIYGRDGAGGGGCGAVMADIILGYRHMGHQPDAGRHHVRHGTDAIATRLPYRTQPT